MISDADKAWMARAWSQGWKQKLIGETTGYHVSKVCTSIKQFCEKWAKVDVEKQCIYNGGRVEVAKIAVRNFVQSTGCILKLPQPLPMDWPSDKVWARARIEHAWLLRAENKTYREIGERLGVSHTFAYQLVERFGKDITASLRKSNVKISVGSDL